MAHKEHCSKKNPYKYIATGPTRLYMSTFGYAKAVALNLPILYSHQKWRRIDLTKGVQWC